MTLDQPLIVPAIRLDHDAKAEEKLALERASKPWLAGFILFGGEAEQVAALTARLRAEAGREIFIASDMERGAGQQIQGLTQLPDAGLVGLAGMPPEAFALGLLTAHEALSVGIDVVCAPCVDVRSEMDNPILGNRSYGYDPYRVGLLGCAFAAGVLHAGARPVAKHFPGHGATTEDSHDTVPVVGASAETLRLRDLLPFERLLGGVDGAGVMTGHVAYPALDSSGAIATFSTPIVDIARSYAADALVFTDALIMAGAMVEGGEPEAARRALAAGCDMLLYPEEPEAVAAAVNAPAGTGRLAAFLRPTRDDAYGELPYEFQRAGPRVARRAVTMACGPAWLGGDVLVLDDDGIEDRGAVLSERARAANARLRCVRVPDGAPPAASLVAPGAHPLALVVFASARAWKGTSGVSPACFDLVAAIRSAAPASHPPQVFWCTPRPIEAGGPHMPGSGPHLEAALADYFWPPKDSK